MSNKDRLYKVAAQISVKYGGSTNFIYTDRRIYEFWSGKDMPSPEYLKRATNISHIKWAIRNKVKSTDKVWDAGFLHGVATAGQLKWNETTFPTLDWYGNDSLTGLIEQAPFGGQLNKAATELKAREKRSWIRVPAFYLDYDSSSISFMAGVMATGENATLMGGDYVKYHIRLARYFH